jgi:hypothetical protein
VAFEESCTSICHLPLGSQEAENSSYGVSDTGQIPTSSGTSEESPALRGPGSSCWKGTSIGSSQDLGFGEGVEGTLTVGIPTVPGSTGVGGWGVLSWLPRGQSQHCPDDWDCPLTCTRGENSADPPHSSCPAPSRVEFVLCGAVQKESLFLMRQR